MDTLRRVRRRCPGTRHGSGFRAVCHLRRIPLLRRPYAAPYAPYAYSQYWATPYTYAYPATASSAWGYPYWYGINSPWTGEASASSHPAYRRQRR